MCSRASKSKPSARWGGTGMRARGLWLQTMMWYDAVFPKVTGCRTRGGDAPRRLALICVTSGSRSRELRKSAENLTLLGQEKQPSGVLGSR